MRQSTPKSSRIAHVGIAVRSIEEALPFYREILGLAEVEMADSDGARIAALDAGGPIIELLESKETDSPIGKFVAKRGPAIHHISFAVDDLDAPRSSAAAQRGPASLTMFREWAPRENALHFFIPPRRAGF